MTATAATQPATLAPKTALEVNHERRVAFIRHNYATASVRDLIGVQAVNCADYYRYKAEGLTELAERKLLQINAMGEYIDARDGTRRA